MRGINQRDDRVELEVLLQLLVDEEGLRDWTRIGQSRGFDQHIVEAVTALAQLPEHADQIAAHRAADAAVGGFEQFLLRANHQFVIDPHFAEFIFDDRDALAVILGQYAVQQRGLAGTQEAGQHRDRDTRTHDLPRPQPLKQARHARHAQYIEQQRPAGARLPGQRRAGHRPVEWLADRALHVNRAPADLEVLRAGLQLPAAGRRGADAADHKIGKRGRQVRGIAIADRDVHRPCRALLDAGDAQLPTTCLQLRRA